MFEISREDSFSGAHRLRGYQGKCESMHGHNWRVKVFVGAEELDELGMVIDFHVLGKQLGETLNAVDHKDLNEVPPFDEINPSSENMAKYIFEEISRRVNSDRARVTKVKVWETDRSCATYRD